ncbi:PAS domain-containing protein [Aliihoeflea aestuarii]|jgi:PAS domain S-box-containing protein|uniref:PAS domain-containing sensor histidine kinase n=1 Tax=Aliihoeflea aestuarii TaxID=453840 RepID=UPI002093378C|nr:PAS domain-containing protein [Aliihoeflea aestuarii]MCO6391635.1 PAS domain-containing protein [Aliihoeflea aestuarii]
MTDHFPATVDDRTDFSARQLFERIDWSATEMGAVANWPRELLGVAGAVFASPLPMCLFVGTQARMLYNDAYRIIAGDRHPHCFGEPLLTGWPEVADFNRAMLAEIGNGGTLSFQNQQLELFRNGAPETVFLDLHYSGVPDAEGRIIGVLAVVQETTGRVNAQKALLTNAAQLELATQGAGLVGHWDWNVDADIVTADASFADLYNVPVAEAARGVPIGRFLEAIHPDDRDMLGEQIDAALRERVELRARYRVRRPNGDIVWVLALGRVSGGDGTGPLRLPGISIDVTDQHRAQEALAESEAKFRAIADAMPQMVWSATPDGLHDYYNARWYEFTGAPEGTTDGEGWNDMFHPDDQARAWGRWRHSLETGELYQIEYRLRHRSGEYRWTLGRALPIRDEAGRIIRWFGTCTDIHETKIAAEEREVVAQELSHRIKNIFSVLGSIVSLTARSRPEAQGFAEELRARILALGTAHEFVRPRALETGPGSHASFHGLVTALLSAYDQGGRISIGGADVPVSEAAATPLALIFHELATNAAKYGSLAEDGGLLDITTRIEDGHCVIVWKERLAKAAPQRFAEPAKAGFGTRLIELSVRGQMGGTIERHFDTDGLRVEIDLPEWALRRSARLAPRS